MATLSWETTEGRKECRLGPLTRIGRAPQNEICLTDLGVSGSHARIVGDADGWALEDESSKNGSFVNGRRETRCALRDGDVIRIGTVDLTFREPMATEEATLVWRKGASAPVPSDVGEQAKATSLDELFGGEASYNLVSSVDHERFTTAVEPMADEDPAELARRLKASYEISRATAATLDPSEILDRVLAAVFEIFDKAERAFILLVDSETREVSTAAVKRRVEQRAGEMPISRTALEQAMRDREALLCHDASTDARFADSQSIVRLGIRSMMVAPLVFRDEVLGAIHVDTVTGIKEFTQPDLELLCVAASQVAGCLANAQLHGKVVRTERLAAVGQTLAGLTHCIKNILQGVKGGAFILDVGLKKENLDRVKTGWEMVRRNNAFMEELVYDLLTYSKPREPAYEQTDANALCREICELCSERAKDKGVGLSFEPDEWLGPVEIDAKGIRRSLLNLVMNAVDACADTGGAATVRTCAPGDDGLFRIIVQDTGCGMSEETLAKLFTVFFSTKGSKGTGLGLPVTRKIVEEHGGRIDVESNEGEGTTFTIWLPPSPGETREE